MHESRTVAIFWTCALALAAVILGLWFWWDRIATNPQNVFWSTISQSLATQSATIDATQTQNGATVHQLTAFSLGPTAMAHALVTVNQGTSTIKTEVIGTKDTDYTRYLAINTHQKDKSGRAPDLKRVLGVWAKGSAASNTQASSTQLLHEAGLGTGLPVGSVPVLIANLPVSQRTSLIGLMHDDQFYTVDFSKVQKSHQNGRLQYTYEASIQPIIYVDVLKEFAKDLGFHDFDNVDPNTFQNVANIKVRLTMDVRAHHLTKVAFESWSGSQAYTGYDVPLAVSAPGQTISTAELQQRLQSL